MKDTLVDNGTTPIIFHVLLDLIDRAKMGKKKYGVYLQANNGRSALQDAYEEAMDLCMYLRQAIEEQENNDNN